MTSRDGQAPSGELSEGQAAAEDDPEPVPLPSLRQGVHPPHPARHLGEMPQVGARVYSAAVFRDLAEAAETAKRARVVHTRPVVLPAEPR